MSVKNIFTSLLVFMMFVFFFSSVKLFRHKRKYENEVFIHLLSNPNGLNPLRTADASTRNYISPYVFQPLIAYDYKTYDMLPVLASYVPKVERIGDALHLTLEIRPEAKWDNGNAVTAFDVAFSYKAVICKAAQTATIRPAIDFFKNIILYPDNPRKITFITGLVPDVLSSLYDIKILPEYIFDSKHILRKYTFAQLATDDNKFSISADIKEFAALFNSEKATHDISMAKGSAAYEVTAFDNGQRILLNKKKNWWGHILVKENMYFEAFPEKLNFIIINDYNTAFTALKNEQLDFLLSAPIKDYIDLDDSPKFRKNFYKSTPPMFGYQCIGMNYHHPILKDTLVRKALAHLMNVDQLIDKFFYGYAKRTIGSIQPDKPYYNDTIQPYVYNPTMAISLLRESGWKDTDNDGILDKIIDGKKTSFELTYTYNNSNPIREMIGLLFQRSCYQAGIRINIKPMEWALLLDDLKKHKCELWYFGYSASPGLEDEKQTYHTSSIADGGNFMNFGNAKTDKLIEELRSETDTLLRNQMYRKWQEIEQSDIPVIYMFVQKYRNCIHRRFENIHESSIYPGVWFAGFQLNKEYTSPK